MICSHDGADPLDAVQVTVAINLSAEEVPWESSPEGADWLANELRLSKGGFMYFWRSCLDPIWNHYIRGPVRVWSVDDGLDERALTALEARDSESLKRLIPEPADGRLQLREGLGAALAHLLDDAELIVGDGGAEFSGQADAPARPDVRTRRPAAAPQACPAHCPELTVARTLASSRPEPVNGAA